MSIPINSGNSGKDDKRAFAWLGFAPSSAVILLIDLAVLVLVWHVASVSLEERFLPTPGDVLGRFFSELREGELLNHTLISTRRVILSIIIGTITAVPLALLTAQVRLLDRVLTPLLYFAYPAPKVVFLPLIIFAFGLGDASRIFLISLVIFFQVFVIIYGAASQVQPQTLESIVSLGAGRWALLRYVYIPVSVPAIVTALKISVGTAIAVLYIAEGIAGRTGLGYYINDNYQFAQYTNIYAGIIAISLLGLVLFVFFDVLERYFTRWQKK